jgi:signal transduction histidine kinase
MIPSSLRWRLPLSYAAIALLTTLALGAILLATLRGFYRQQELEYLWGNARAISEEMTSILQSEPGAGFLPAQVKGLAFLSQTRVKIVDPAKESLLADSGDPGLGDGNTQLTLNVEIDGVAQSFSQSVDQQGSQANTRYSSSIILETGSLSRNVEEQVWLGDGNAAGLASQMPVAGTLYGFGLGPPGDRAGQRSTLVMDYPIHSETGQLLGYVELSQGPAYGRTILRSVAWGWAIASGLATLLAAGTGWLISRRLTTPLLALTAVTTRMAAGDLAARANVERRDELGALGDAFNTMASRVQKTVDALRQFVADAAHELHTPLTALQTNLDLISQGEVETVSAEADQQRLRRAQEQVQRLQALTHNLLGLSQIEAAKAHDWDEVSLNRLLQVSSELYASRAEQTGLAFELSLPQETVRVMGDEAQLQQVLANLLDNSLKFTSAPGEVVVSLEQESDWAVIEIVDSGIGISLADQDRLFSRFHRGRNTADYPGSGLGLAIVKAIIEQHRGEVRVSSAGDGQGCRASVRLPLT